MTNLYIIYQLCVPFLRCAALLFRHWTDVLPGSELAERGAGMQYPVLAQYLGLPASLTSLLETPVCCDLLSSLLGRPRPATPALPTYPMGYRVAGQLPGSGATPRPGLVQLPHNYTDLMNLAATFSCSRTKYFNLSGAQGNAASSASVIIPSKHFMISSHGIIRLKACPRTAVR